LLPGIKNTRLIKRRDLANEPPSSQEWSLGLIEEDSWLACMLGLRKNGLGFRV
jgi:hypothetical protein